MIQYEKKQNLRITGEKGEKSQLKGPENIFNSFIEGIFSDRKMRVPINLQEAHKVPIVPGQKRKSSHHITIKTLNIQSKGRIIKASRKKDQVINKGRPIRNTPDIPMETLNFRRTEK